MSRGHAARCADAVRTTPDECECQCRGMFHGGPHSERVRALIWDKDRRIQYSGRQLSRSKRRAKDALAARQSVGEACTDFAVVHAVDALIRSAEPVEHDAARDVMAAVVRPFVEEIANAKLDDEDADRLEAAVNEQHILCALCAAVLEMIEAARELTEDVADEIATRVVAMAQQGPPLSAVATIVLRRALRQSLAGLVDIVAHPAQVRLLQFVGYATCPDVFEHPEVRKYCIEPLKDDLVSTAMDSWIADGFPADAAVLRQAPRRRRKR